MKNRQTYPITFSLYTDQLARIEDLARARFDGNRSQALRRIVDAYLDGGLDEVIHGYLAGQVTADELAQAVVSRRAVP